MTAFFNNLKTVLFLGMLTGLIVAVGGLMGKQYILPFLAISIVMNFGIWFFSDTIAIKSMQGREVTAANGPDLYRLVEELSLNAGVPTPRVYMCPQQSPNAFATGRSPSHSAVAVTEGAVRLLNYEELRGVLAHELAHIKNRDTLISTVAAVVAGVLASIAQWGFLLGGNRENSNPLIALVVTIVAALGAAMLRAAISRSREFVADADGARIAGNPNGLISALRKLEMAGRQVPLHTPNPAMNNMFIIEPFAGKSMLNMFATHPPTEDRVAALTALRQLM